MDIRPFDWRDIPALHRNRHNSVFLNISLLLTRGPLIIPGALLSYMVPSMGVFTCVGNSKANDEFSVIGQAIHQPGSRFSHMTFVTPETTLDTPVMSAMVEFLMKISGMRGATRLLADVDEQHQAYEMLRRSSFATYTRQRVWQIQDHNTASQVTTWQTASSRDGQAIMSLYHNLVPAMVQQAEPFSGNKPRGLVHRQAGEILAYVELRYGHRGIWAQPFLHPDTLDVDQKFGDLVRNLPNRRSRPVFISVRSYQSWLENTLKQMGAQPGPSQALMVKHMAVSEKAQLTYEVPAIESGQPEVTASITHLESKLRQ